MDDDDMADLAAVLHNHTVCSISAWTPQYFLFSGTKSVGSFSEQTWTIEHEASRGRFTGKYSTSLRLTDVLSLCFPSISTTRC